MRGGWKTRQNLQHGSVLMNTPTRQIYNSKKERRSTPQREENVEDEHAGINTCEFSD